jgi:hypothetical protein
MEHFLVATISKVHFEVMEQPNPNRVAKNEVECRYNGPLLIFRESRQALRHGGSVEAIIQLGWCPPLPAYVCT